MLGHVRPHASKVLEKAHVCQLGELLGTHALDGKGRTDVPDVLVVRGDKGDARAGEGHLGRRAKLIDEAVRAGIPERIEDVEQPIVLVAKAVHHIGIVPVDAEVGRGRAQGGKAPHDLVGVGDARGIGVLGHAPDALDGGIALDKLLHHVHVGTILTHGHAHVRDAQVLRHPEVPVVTRGRTQPRDLALLPEGSPPRHAVGEGVCHEVMHEVEARRAGDHHVLGVHAQHLPRQGTSGGQPLRRAIVVHDGIAIVEWRGGAQDVEHGSGEGRLLGAGLAPRHVERQTLRLDGVRPRLKVGDASRKLVIGQCLIRVPLGDAHVLPLA